MIYLLAEIFLYLVLSAAIGFLVGWFLKHHYMSREVAQLEKIWKANLYSKDEELKELRAQHLED